MSQFKFYLTTNNGVHERKNQHGHVTDCEIYQFAYEKKWWAITRAIHTSGGSSRTHSALDNGETRENKIDKKKPPNKTREERETTSDKGRRKAKWPRATNSCAQINISPFTSCENRITPRFTHTHTHTHTSKNKNFELSTLRNDSTSHCRTPHNGRHTKRPFSYTQRRYGSVALLSGAFIGLRHCRRVCPFVGDSKRLTRTKDTQYRKCFVSIAPRMSNRSGINDGGRCRIEEIDAIRLRFRFVKLSGREVDDFGVDKKNWNGCVSCGNMEIEC